MSLFDFAEPAPPATVDQLAAVESVLGELPLSLIEMYTVQNGGRPSKPYFLSESGSDYLLASVFPVPAKGATGRSNDIVDVNSSLRRDKLIADEDFVFGDDPGDNFYSVNAHSGHVFFHPMDTWEEDLPLEENRAATMDEVSPSLHDFMSKLADNPY